MPEVQDLLSSTELQPKYSLMVQQVCEITLAVPDNPRKKAWPDVFTDII